MSNQTTLFHGGAYEITKASEPQAGLVVQVFDMEEDASSVAPMTPAEWDAFVVKGNAALGREQGATVPRGEVADVVPLLAGVSTILANSDDAEAKREAVRRLDRIVVVLGRMVTDGPAPGER